MFCENVVRDLSIFADVFTFKSYEVLEENCHHCIECSGLRHFSLLFFHKLLAAPIVRQSFQGIILRCPLVGFAVYQLLPVLSQNSSKKIGDILAGGSGYYYDNCRGGFCHGLFVYYYEECSTC